MRFKYIQLSGMIAYFIISICTLLCGRARANDSDVGENARVEYYLQQSDRTQFSISPSDGRLFTQHPFDRERESRYELRIFARNPGKPGFTATATVSVRPEFRPVQTRPDQSSPA